MGFPPEIEAVLPPVKPAAAVPKAAEPPARTTWPLAQPKTPAEKGIMPASGGLTLDPKTPTDLDAPIMPKP